VMTESLPFGVELAFDLCCPLLNALFQTITGIWYRAVGRDVPKTIWNKGT
jgi:hypothetical protein